MQFNLYLLHTALLATAALARPSEVSSRMNHELTKRHCWCNGVDSENICPEGETMVPIDQYACDAISSAGRISQISSPVNGETSTTCQQQTGSSESTPVANPNTPTQLTCTEVDGLTGSSFLLNCTMAA